jgi:hypothetical protein
MACLQENEFLPAAEVVDPHAPNCTRCNQRMWLSWLETKVGTAEVTSKREYDCRACRGTRVVVTREPL